MPHPDLYRAFLLTRQPRFTAIRARLVAARVMSDPVMVDAFALDRP